MNQDYALFMLRSVDIAISLKLTLAGASEMSFQQLASDLHLSSSEVHAAFKRLRLSGLLAHDGSKSINRSALLEFLKHGVRYAFPAELGNLTRGIPTAHAAEPLKGALQQHAEPPPVWPYVEGKVRGYSVAPLYKRAVAAALQDEKFYELLSLVDALREGRVREKSMAIKELEMRLAHGQ